MLELKIETFYDEEDISSFQTARYAHGNAAWTGSAGGMVIADPMPE